MESIDQYSLSLCVHNIVVEIIHRQYLKGFLVKPRRKKCSIGEVFFWEIPV